jgi:hypothetical protein
MARQMRLRSVFRDSLLQSSCNVLTPDLREVEEPFRLSQGANAPWIDRLHVGLSQESPHYACEIGGLPGKLASKPLVSL